MAKTRYDEVAYPSGVFPQTNPERLAVLAHIHGLAAPDVATARVLEIAGGDGLSVMAFAATYPKAQVCNFDLSASAIARGQAKADAGGFTNVTLEVLDIMAGRGHFAPRSFDYVIAHGIYAWVPDRVRREIMALIGHVLTEDGMAFGSFNAKPGGHMRMIMRDMLTYVLQGIEDPQQKLAAMRECLTDFAIDQKDDSPLQTGVRMHARAILAGSMNVVWHDELGPDYNPQQLSDVVDAAEAVGLAFLTDGGRNLHCSGFLPDGYGGATSGPEADATAVRNAQLDDFATMRFFRQPVFIRQGRSPSRVFDPDRLRGLFISTTLAHAGGSEFADRRHKVEITDEKLAEAIKRVAARGLRRTAVRDLSLEDTQLRALLELFTKSFVWLWTGPDPYAAAPGERPTTSALIRSELGVGEIVVHTLDESELRLEQPEMRRLLIAADGTRTMDDLAALPDLGPLSGDVPKVLAEAARRALLIA